MPKVQTGLKFWQFYALHAECVGVMLQKKLNDHLYTETISELTVYSQLF